MQNMGDRVGPYTLTRFLGQGGMGYVWLAESPQGPFPRVAIKFAYGDQNAIDSFRREAEIWARVSGHPNIASFIEVALHGQQILIVSEFVSDGSLLEWIKRSGGKAPSIESAIVLIDGILQGLQHAHERGVIHRDVKPSNILLQGMTPRLVDFGVSRIVEATSGVSRAVGSPAFMAPEAFSGTFSKSTDLWAVGVLLYALLMGSLPFPDREMWAWMNAIKYEDPVPLAPTVPRFLHQILARVLSKDPHQRFASAAEMRAELLQTPIYPTGRSQTLPVGDTADPPYIPIDVSNAMPWAFNPKSPATPLPANTRQEAEFASTPQDGMSLEAMMDAPFRPAPSRYRAWWIALLITVLLGGGITIGGIAFQNSYRNYQSRVRAANITALNDQGRDAYSKHDFSAAAQHFEKALAANPAPEQRKLLNTNLAYSYVKMAQAATANHDLQGARNYYKKALDAYPDYTQAHQELAAVDRSLNLTEEAKQHETSAQNDFIDKRRQEAKRLIAEGDSLDRKGDSEGAVAKWTEAIATAPATPEARSAQNRINSVPIPSILSIFGD